MIAVAKLTSFWIAPVYNTNRTAIAKNPESLKRIHFESTIGFVE